jgi:hypothetical protein
MDVEQTDGTQPRIWVLCGNKIGDNAQVLRAVGAMRVDYAVRNIVLLPQFDTAKPRVAATLDHIDMAKSDRLEPPWPDLVVTIGRRLSSVALWIKQQSSDATRIALFNPPKGGASKFDLIIAPVYYSAKPGPALCRVNLPLIAVDAVKLAEARLRFADVLAALPCPLHVLLLGGATKQMRLDGPAVADIIKRMRSSFANNGSIYVCTSRRTSPAAIEGARARLGPVDRIYRWTPGDSENPYLGLLAHGDTFTVTGDSLSMLTEVTRLGRPLVIAELPPRNALVERLFGKAPPAMVHRLVRWLSDRQVRDFRGFHQFLCTGGYAVMLGERPRPPLPPPEDDTPRVAQELVNLIRRAS